ncbi:MAG: acyltransferase domain-containing protein, partial [Vicinamibacterales bacterium]
MLAIKTGEQEVLPLLDRALSVAAVNSPSSCVVSGLSAGIDALEKRLRTQDIQCTRLHTSHAFHSAMMDEILDPFERQFAGVRLSAPKIPFVSNLTGRWISPDEATSPRYWVRHLRETVRFADGLTALLSQADRVLLEVGPGATLTTLARQHPLRDAARAIVASLPAATENTSDGRVAVSTFGRLWLSGVEVDWDGFHRHERRRRIPLPTYPFEHQYHWIDAIRRETVEPPVSIADAGRQRSDSWFWTPVWKKTPPVDASRDLDTSNWVVFGDDDSLTTNVLAQLREIQSDGGGNARLELCEAGDFNSLAVRRVSRTEPGPGEVELEVRTAGLNFRDVLIALGAYPDAESAVMGSECAG